MDDFLTTLTKRSLNLLPVVQPAIASMFVPAAAIATDLFYSVPAFEVPEVRDNLEERADALTQPIGPSFSLSHPVQMKSVLSANIPIAPDHLSFQSSALTFDLGLQTHVEIREPVAQNIAQKADPGEDLGVSSPVGNQIPFEAIASIQPSEESAVTRKRTSVNALEPQQNLSESKKKQEKKGENLVIRPSPEAVQVAATDSRQPIVSEAVPPLENAVRRTREGDIAETQAPLDPKFGIDAPSTVINLSFQGIKEPEKLPAATTDLALGHFEAIDAIASIQPSVESTLTPPKTSFHAVESPQNLSKIHKKETDKNTEKSIPIAFNSPPHKIEIIQRQQDIHTGIANSQPVGIYQTSDQQQNVVQPMLPERDRFEGQVPLHQKSGVDAPSTVINSSFQGIREPEKLPAATSNLALGHFEVIEAIASIQPSVKSTMTPPKTSFNAVENPQNLSEIHKKETDKNTEKSIPIASNFPLNKIGIIQRQQDIQPGTANSQPVGIYQARDQQENVVRPMLPERDRSEGQVPLHQKSGIDAPSTVINLSFQGIKEQEKLPVATPNLGLGHFEAIDAIASIQPSEKSEITHEKPLFKAVEQPQNMPDSNKKQEGKKAEKLISTGSDFHSPKIGTLQKRPDIQTETSNSQQSPIYEASHPQENADRPMRSLAGRDESQALSHRMQAIDALVTMTGLSSQGVSKSEKTSGFTPNLLVGNLEVSSSGFHLSESSQITAVTPGNGIELEPHQGNSEKLELELKRPEYASNLISSSGHSLDTLTERSRRSMERESSEIEVYTSQETEGTVSLPQTLKAQTVSYFKPEQNIKKTHIKPPTEEKRELARLSIAKVENVNSKNYSLPMSDRHRLNDAGEPLVWETPVEINALVHRVDTDKRALVRPLFDSGMGVLVDTCPNLFRAAEQNLLSKQPSRLTQRRSTDSEKMGT